MLDSILGENAEIKDLQSRCARVLNRAGISANAATMLALVTGMAAGVEFGRGHAVVGIVALAISAGFDAVDGAIARECATPSAIGGVLDLTSDRIVETFAIVGIAWRDPALYFPALMLVGSWYINITLFLAVGAALERHGPKLIDYPPGILERTEAIVFFTVLAVGESVGVLRPLGPLLCYAMTALEIATGVQRLAFGLRMLRTNQ